MAQIGVTLPETEAEAIDYAALACGLAKRMVADKNGMVHLPELILESMWIVGGLSIPAIMPEVLAALGAEDVGVKISGTLQPADVALRLWRADRKRANHIYLRHYNDTTNNHPTDEKQSKKQGRMDAHCVIATQQQAIGHHSSPISPR